MTIVVRSANVTDGAAGARVVEVELEFTSSVALDVSPDDWRLPTERRSTRDHRIGRAATR